jgi:hypothetical protein
MNATEKHAILVERGWRVRLDGRWISPNPGDARFVFTLAAAWHQHQAERDDPTDPDGP